MEHTTAIQQEVRKVEKVIDNLEVTIFNAYNALQTGHMQIAMQQLFEALPEHHKKTQGKPNKLEVQPQMAPESYDPVGKIKVTASVAELRPLWTKEWAEEHAGQTYDVVKFDREGWAHISNAKFPPSAYKVVA